MEIFKSDYDFNLVMCIDGTKFMMPYIDKVKQSMKGILNYLKKEMGKLYGVSIDQIRVRFIVFRDFKYSDKPLEDSGFINYTQNEEMANSFIDNITAEDKVSTSNAFEALALAIKSDWFRSEHRSRQSIIIYTNSGVLPLQLRKDSAGYPDGMPKDFDELSSWWNDTKDGGERLHHYGSTMFIIVPKERYPWNEIRNWRWVFPYCAFSNSCFDDAADAMGYTQIAGTLYEID